MSRKPGNSKFGELTNRSCLTMPLSSDPSCSFMPVARRPIRPPPKSFGCKPTSCAARTRPSVSKRVGGGENHIWRGRLDGADDRAKVGRAGRIALVVDDLEAERLRVLARAVGGVARKFRVSANDRDSLRPWRLLRRDLEEAARHRDLGIRAERNHREVLE